MHQFGINLRHTRHKMQAQFGILGFQYQRTILENILHNAIQKSEVWEMLVNFHVNLLRQTQGVSHFEYKPGDPGLDLIPTLQLAIQFCEEINRQLGRKGMLLNNEWALMASGESVLHGTNATIDAGLFDGFVHVNSGQKLPFKLDELLAHAVHPSQLPVLMDWDWAVGIGDSEVVDSQAMAALVLRRWSAETGLPVHAEHDLHHFGKDPISYARLSIENLANMWND